MLAITFFFEKEENSTIFFAFIFKEFIDLYLRIEMKKISLTFLGKNKRVKLHVICLDVVEQEMAAFW